MLIRRSNLMVPITSPRFASRAWMYFADAITLDLEDGVIPTRKAEARSLIKDTIGQVGVGAAEVFVRINKAFIHADIEAAVWPGLKGIMLPQVESAAEVTNVSDIITVMENRRGLHSGSLQLILVIESGQGIWHIHEIIRASQRVSQVCLDESDLAGSFGLNPVSDYDPFIYARGRLVTEAIAAQVQPVGAAHTLGLQPALLHYDELFHKATDSKNLGFKGIICPHPIWIAPVNKAFTPSEDLVAWNRRVRETFAEGVAAGTAAVPLDGKMIDVPVDEWAKVVIDMAAACTKRDAEKEAALAKYNAKGINPNVA